MCITTKARGILLNGDYVTNRMGKETIYSQKFEAFFNNGTLYSLRNYNENLSHTSKCMKYDVMTIERNGVIIWERKEFCSYQEALKYMENGGEASFNNGMHYKLTEQGYLVELYPNGVQDGNFVFSKILKEPYWKLL